MSVDDWMRGAVDGAPDAHGFVRRWTHEDAARLASRGVILTPSGAFAVGTIDKRPAAERCQYCGERKAIVKPTLDTERWCYGCGEGS